MTTDNTPTDPTTHDRLRALREWQDYAGALSDALLALGHHNAAKHQSPQEYDAESGLACSIPSCLAALARPPAAEGGERLFDWNKVGPELEALGQAIADTIDPANPMQTNESTMDCLEHLWAAALLEYRSALAASRPAPVLDVEALARFVVREHPTGAGDWACAECMVARDLHSDLIRDGYRCTPHAAAAYQTALAARTEGRT